MLHLVDELGSLGNQIDDLVLVALTVDLSAKVLLRRLRKEFSDRLNREIDCHDVLILLHLHVASIELEELVDVGGGKLFHLFVYVWKGDGKLVD